MIPEMEDRVQSIPDHEGVQPDAKNTAGQAVVNLVDGR